jgi:hypothetical protein
MSQNRCIPALDRPPPAPEDAPRYDPLERPVSSV